MAIPTIKIHRLLRFRQQDLDAWIAKRRYEDDACPGRTCFFGASTVTDVCPVTLDYNDATDPIDWEAIDLRAQRDEIKARLLFNLLPFLAWVFPKGALRARSSTWETCKAIRAGASKSSSKART